jgi:hypothetical protein
LRGLLAISETALSDYTIIGTPAFRKLAYPPDLQDVANLYPVLSTSDDGYECDGRHFCLLVLGCNSILVPDGTVYVKGLLLWL